jgi:hypothetical protein
MNKILAIALSLLVGSLVLAMPVHAQTQSGLSFAGTSEATALNFAGTWSAATDETELLDVLDTGATKSTHISIEGRQLLAPTANFSSYLGGVRVQPDLSKLLANTNIPVNAFSVYIDGAVGDTQYTNKNGSNISFLAGGGIQYQITPALTWSSMHIDYLRVGSINGIEMSTGLQYVFGSSSQAVPAANARILAARKLK